MNKVSVVIPTFNRETTLPRAVKSALQQTHPVHEILVCDDGSTDDSRKVIEALNDPKIKWIDCGRNGMPSIPRNKGIRQAQGEWIAFLDSDDEWLPEKIEWQMKALKASELLASTTNCNRWAGKNNLGPFFSHNKKEISFADLLPVNMNICSSVVVSKTLLESTSLFPEQKEYKAIEDYALWLRIATKTSFAYVNKALVNYFDDPHTSIRSDSLNEQETRKIIFGGLIAWIEEKKIALSEENNNKLKRTYKEILEGKKTGFWQKVKNKLKN